MKKSGSTGERRCPIKIILPTPPRGGTVPTGTLSGEDSNVTLFGHTFTAGGGQPNRGGTASPLNPPDFVADYTISNGQYSIQNRSGGRIDGFSAGDGGNHGNELRAGQDGWVRVRWHYYDGQ